jgi:hypothetical protein
MRLLKDLCWVRIINIFSPRGALQESYLPVGGLETLDTIHSVRGCCRRISESSNVGCTAMHYRIEVATMAIEYKNYSAL